MPTRLQMDVPSARAEEWFWRRFGPVEASHDLRAATWHAPLTLDSRFSQNRSQGMKALRIGAGLVWVGLGSTQLAFAPSGARLWLGVVYLLTGLVNVVFGIFFGKAERRERERDERDLASFRERLRRATR